MSGVHSLYPGHSACTVSKQIGVHNARLFRHHRTKGATMAKPDGKVAVITGGTTGLAPAGAGTTAI